MIEYYDIMDKMNQLIEQSKSRVIGYRDINTREEQEKVLNSLYGVNWESDYYFSNMKYVNIDDKTFLTYDQKKDDEVINNHVMVMIKDEKPLFKCEYLINSGTNITYELIKKTSYIEGTSRVKNKIELKKMSNGDFSESEVYVLNEKNGEYSKHEYTLYSMKNDIYAFVNHGIRWVQGQETFDSRLAIIEDNIKKATMAVESSICSLLDDDHVKVYEISRKK